MSELITQTEFARRLGVSHNAVSNAILTGRLSVTFDDKGRKKLDWETQSVNWEAFRMKKEPAIKINKTGGNFERHIGDTTLYDVGEMGTDKSDSRYDNIPQVDKISAAPGSVAYFQARKLSIDGTRSLLALRQEAGELIAVQDSMSLYCEGLTAISQKIQEIPAKVSNVIVANIRKSVEQWKTPPENLEAEIFRLLTNQVKAVLTDIATDLEKAEDKTKEFIDSNVVGKKNKRKKK